MASGWITLRRSVYLRKLSVHDLPGGVVYQAADPNGRGGVRDRHQGRQGRGEPKMIGKHYQVEAGGPQPGAPLHRREQHRALPTASPARPKR
jgi:hypothetical protein